MILLRLGPDLLEFLISELSLFRRRALRIEGLFFFYFFFGLLYLKLSLLDVIVQLGGEVPAVFIELEAPNPWLIFLELSITELTKLKLKNIRKRAPKESPVNVVVLAAGRVIELLTHWTAEFDFALSHFVVSAERKHQLLFTQNAGAVAKISFDEFLSLRQ